MTWCHKRLSLKTIPNSEWSSFKNLVKLSCEELSYYYDCTSKMIRMGKILKMRTGTSCFTYLASLWWKNKIQKVNLRKLGWSLGRNLFKKAKKIPNNGFTEFLGYSKSFYNQIFTLANFCKGDYSPINT